MSHLPKLIFESYTTSFAITAELKLKSFERVKS